MFVAFVGGEIIIALARGIRGIRLRMTGGRRPLSIRQQCLACNFFLPYSAIILET